MARYQPAPPLMIVELSRDKTRVRIRCMHSHLMYCMVASQSLYFTKVLKGICSVGYRDLSWLMWGKRWTLTTAQNPFKLPAIGNPSPANSLLSNVLIISYHIFKHFPPVPNQEVCTMHTPCREESKWNIGSWFKWTSPTLNSRGRRNIEIEKRITYSSSSIVDAIIIWSSKKKDVLICWEEYISSGRWFGDSTMNNNEVSRLSSYVNPSSGLSTQMRF